MYRYVEIAYDDSVSGDIWDEIEDFVHAKVCDRSDIPGADCNLISFYGTCRETIEEIYTVLDHD